MREPPSSAPAVSANNGSAEVEPASGAIVHLFNTGTVVRLVLLAGAAHTEVLSDHY